MFGINEILKNVLTEEEKIKILNSKKIEDKVIEYLIERFSNLYIEVLGDYEGFLLELMKNERLLGWCWQTTESAIVFLDDNDYIERGDLYLDKYNPKYYHSWICFKFNNVEYVLDPCLNLLCRKKYYLKIFEPKIKGKVSAKDVKEELIRQIRMPKAEKNSEVDEHFKKFLKLYFGNKYEKKKDEITVHGPEDVNTPLYRNGAGYKTEIENNKIKKMTVHFYNISC